MTSVERVKAYCKSKKIAISTLEKELGYSNGYIGKLRKGVFPDDRLVEIAKFLGVSVSYLLGDTDDPSDKSLTHWADLHYGSNPKREDFEVGANGLPVHIGNKKSPTPEGVERIPGYSDLNSANQAIIDNLIAQLLAAQSDD